MLRSWVNHGLVPDVLICLNFGKLTSTPRRFGKITNLTQTGDTYQQVFSTCVDLKEWNDFVLGQNNKKNKLSMQFAAWASL